jgi:transposase-like protein
VAEDLRMALLEVLRKAELDEDIDFLREGVRTTAQQLMELEVAQHVGADKYERSANRNGPWPPVLLCRVARQAHLR